MSLEVAHCFECDFADLFEVKAARIEKKGRIFCEIDQQNQALRFIYRRDGFERQTVIEFTERPRLEKGRALFDITVPARGTWQTCIVIAMVIDAGAQRPKYGCDAFAEAETKLQRSLQEWDWKVPDLSSDCDFLNHTYRRSYIDLAALRLRVGDRDEHWLPAAGLPWFMTIFGRDTLITSYQTLVFGPDLATGALLRFLV